MSILIKIALAILFPFATMLGLMIFGFFPALRQKLWGEVSDADLKQFGFLSLIFIFIIGSYWLMRPLKDGLFTAVVGIKYLPIAKIMSFFFIIPAVFLYSKLVDLVEKQKLFYILIGIYATLFAAVTFLLGHSTIGLVNTVPAWNRWFGWIIYLGVESFGSMLVPLFWSFVVSSTDTATAKRGFAIIIAGAQIGAISGPLLASQAEHVGMSFLTSMVVICLLLVPLLVKLYIIKYPAAAESRGNVDAKPKTGMLEGLRLIFKNPYLVGVFGVATLYEVVLTIMDYQMKVLAKGVYPTTEGLTSFLGEFGVATNGLALAFAFIGTSFFIRRFGLIFCLVAYPVLMAFFVFGMMIVPTSLAFVFFAVMAGKGLSYALNNPCKEIMFIPTSKDVKFKAKGWIDSFGSRFSKGPAASSVNWIWVCTGGSVIFGSCVSFALIGVWLVSALYVGRKNKELTASGEVIS